MARLDASDGRLPRQIVEAEDDRGPTRPSHPPVSLDLRPIGIGGRVQREVHVGILPFQRRGRGPAGARGRYGFARFVSWFSTGVTVRACSAAIRRMAAMTSGWRAATSK